MVATSRTIAHPSAGRSTRNAEFAACGISGFSSVRAMPHMPKEYGGMGLGHVAMAAVSAEAAKSGFGPFALNAQAPDEGNMHTLLHWANDAQKEKYLRPLCDGFIRSCFAMTEPEVAGSDHEAAVVVPLRDALLSGAHDLGDEVAHL